jgi:hypothetical protein
MLEPVQAARLVSDIDGATWMAVSEAQMRTALERVRNLPSPKHETGVRWTQWSCLCSYNASEQHNHLIGELAPPFNRSDNGSGVESAIELLSGGDLIPRCVEAAGVPCRRQSLNRQIRNGRRGALPR